MATQSLTGIKRPYLDHLSLDHVLQPIDGAGAGPVRVDYMENLLGHRSGLNVAANQTAANIGAHYSTFTTVPQKQGHTDEQNRGNPNNY